MKTTQRRHHASFSCLIAWLISSCHGTQTHLMWYEARAPFYVAWTCLHSIYMWNGWWNKGGRGPIKRTNRHDWNQTEQVYCSQPRTPQPWIPFDFVFPKLALARIRWLSHSIYISNMSVHVRTKQASQLLQSLYELALRKIEVVEPWVLRNLLLQYTPDDKGISKVGL